MHPVGDSGADICRILPVLSVRDEKKISLYLSIYLSHV